MPDAMTVGALATRTGVPAKTIRYYESVGLLPPPRRLASGYRAYDDSYVRRLEFIARAKRLGLSLEEIAEIFRLRDAGVSPCAHVTAVLDRHVARVDEAMDELSRFRSELAEVRASTASAGDGAVCGLVEHAELSGAVPVVLRPFGTRGA